MSKDTLLTLIIDDRLKPNKDIHPNMRQFKVTSQVLVGDIAFEEDPISALEIMQEALEANFRSAMVGISDFIKELKEKKRNGYL